MNVKSLIKVPLNFHDEVETLVTDGSLNYFEAVIEWCHKRGVEVEQAAQYIKYDPALRSKIMIDAENLNMLKEKTARIDL